MTTVLVVALVALVLAIGFRLWLTANRLDRLHVRTQAAWVALEGALARRIVATRAVAAVGDLPPGDAEQLRHLAAAADTSDRRGRADRENDLSRSLQRVQSELPSAIPADLVAELHDASERVLLARRFYNDAVRDTRALRADWFTRVCRLAGRAELPDYFEIAEASGHGGTAVAADPAEGNAATPVETAEAHGAPVVPAHPTVERTAARVVLLDHDDRILLLSGIDPDSGVDPARRWWITPGGGLENDEDPAAAAVRELAEETGLHLEPSDLVGPLWRRTAEFVFVGNRLRQHEVYFAARRPERSGAAINPELVTDVEARTLTGHHWWTFDDLGTTTEDIYPPTLATRLPELQSVLTTRRAPREPERID